MTKPRLAVVISTTREGRFGDRPAAWIKSLADARRGAEIEILDLRDYPLPPFDEPVPPAFAASANEVAQRWCRKLREADGFIFVTAEYNHSISGALKNAIDHAYPEFVRKPAAFVGYGGLGAARAIQQLRQIVAELQMAPVRHAVHIGAIEFRGLLMDGKTFADFPYLAEAANLLLDDLMWWTITLREGRRAAREGRPAERDGQLAAA